MWIEKIFFFRIFDAGIKIGKLLAETQDYFRVEVV